jgi:hypothetical protein
MSLHDEALAARSLVAELARVTEDLTDDDAALAVASETNLAEAIEAALLANAMDAAHCEALLGLVRTLEARHDRKRDRIERRKGAILAAMEIAGLPKLELASATVTVGRGKRKVLITDQELIPDEFMRERVTRTPDKDAIQKAILAQRQVSGAELSNTMPTLTVRTK